MIKFAALGIPAAVALVFWRATGVTSRRLHYLSCANVFSFLLWLLAAITLDHSGNRLFSTWMFSSAMGMLIAFPLLAIVASLSLAVGGLFTSGDERWVAAICNGSMALAWAASLIVPN